MSGYRIVAYSLLGLYTEIRFNSRVELSFLRLRLSSVLPAFGGCKTLATFGKIDSSCYISKFVSK